MLYFGVVRKSVMGSNLVPITYVAGIEEKMEMRPEVWPLGKRRRRTRTRRNLVAWFLMHGAFHLMLYGRISVQGTAAEEKRALLEYLCTYLTGRGYNRTRLSHVTISCVQNTLHGDWTGDS